MARKFLTTAIVDPVKAPITKRSLEHLNSAYDELSEYVGRTIIGSYTTNDIIILYGCVVTANIPGTSSVTAGAIYYNGRIYAVDANASISSPSNTLVWSIATTYVTGDPATYSDGSSNNFHQIQKFQLTNAGTGTGLGDYNASTVKYHARSVSFAAGASAFLLGRAVTVRFVINMGTTTSGTTIFTIPSGYRTLSNNGGFISCSCYLGGGGAAQYNLTSIANINTQTGVVSLGLDMPPGTDVVLGEFTYYLD